MNHVFRDLLRKVGSGPHTGTNLTRQEAATAMRLMLLQEATPAQIGAFMIAHRIRRPTGEELAGMLDAYEELGPQLQPVATPHPVMVMGSPYDGRTRTVPLGPVTALVLATAGCPVILHGGDRMPTKAGDPLVDFWQGMGVDWTHLSLNQVQTVLETTGLGFVYQPVHFPLAEGLVTYRDQIGKRPPLATMELMWVPYAGAAHVVVGFVHPPTEGMFQAAFALRGVTRFTTVKGLEGSCDLPRERTAILGLGHPDPTVPEGFRMERWLLHAQEFGLDSRNVGLESTAGAIAAMQATLQGEASEFMTSILWNSGFYLWRCGIAPDVESGMAQAGEILQQGLVLKKLRQVQEVTGQVVLAR
jgi:anthranilate phosphoribosyltransferase